ncbi:MAG TPA: Ig-like domain-containing protein, partial [Conexibacter sp.]|nr:Ig-like domain-containing protein [Conexibacter sp.]
MKPLLALACALLCAAIGACTDTDARTQVMLEIDADAAVRVRLETLRVLIDVSDDEGESWEKRLTRSYDSKDVGGWRKFEWPARLGLVPADNAAGRSFAVRVQALDADGELYVWQQAVAAFTPGHTKLLAMSLIDKCTIAALQCGNASCVGTAGCKTCRAGNCVDVELLASLPDYDPDASGSLFDGSVAFGTDAGPDAGGEDSGPDDAMTPLDAGDAQTPPDDSGPPSDAGDAAATDAGDANVPAPFAVIESTPSAATPVLEDTHGAVSVTFSAPVDAATVTANRFKVTHEGKQVAGVLATSAREASFTPDTPWVLAGAYTLSLNSSIEDSTGRALETFELGFTVRDGVWSRQALFDGNNDPAVALSRDGHGVIEWPRTPTGGGTPEIMAARFAPPATWSAPEQLSGLGASVSVAAINTRHHAAAVWSGISAGQIASVYTSGPAWVVGTSLSPGSDPDVFLSDSDELFFVASDTMNSNALAGFRFTLGAASPAAIPIGVGLINNSNAQIAVVGSTAAVVFQHLDPGANISGVIAGSFDGPAANQISTGGDNATLPQVATNAAQTSAMAVWLEAAARTPALTRVWASRLTTSSVWSTPVPLSQGATSARGPVVAVD